MIAGFRCVFCLLPPLIEKWACLYDTVVSVEAHAAYALKNTESSPKDWLRLEVTSRGHLAQPPLHIQALGFRGVYGICCLPWVLVCSLTSTLLLAQALNSSFVTWQATSPFGEAAELALSELCGSSSGREGAGGCSGWLLERHGLRCSRSVTPRVLWCRCHCRAWNSAPIRVLTAVLYRI